MTPKISVLLPAYNAEKYVEEAIQSILGQTYSNFELLVADDASTDKTREVIESIDDSKIRIFHNPVNMGKTATVEKLFKYATGELVTIHDADDVSLPERFYQQVLEFQHNPELGMCGTSFISITGDGSKTLETVCMKSDYQAILADIDRCPQFHGPTMMMRRCILDELEEIYRPYFKDNYEDTDLAYRIAEKYLSYNLSDILYKYRILPTSLCRRSVNVRNRNLYKAVSFLARERKDRGTDSVATGKPEVVDEYFSVITKKYLTDTSLIHREAAEYLMYWKLYGRAISEACMAVKNNPFRLVNYRTLQYCIRKLMIVTFLNYTGIGST